MWCSGGAEEVQRWCAEEEVQRLCRGGAEVQQSVHVYAQVIVQVQVQVQVIVQLRADVGTEQLQSDLKSSSPNYGPSALHFNLQPRIERSLPSSSHLLQPEPLEK